MPGKGAGEEVTCARRHWTKLLVQFTLGRP